MFLYLLTGTLDVQHGEVTHHVSAGDAVYFDATTIHSYVCAGDDTANRADRDVATAHTGAGASAEQLRFLACAVCSGSGYRHAAAA